MKDLLTLTKIKMETSKLLNKYSVCIICLFCMFAASITGRMDIAEEIV